MDGPGAPHLGVGPGDRSVEDEVDLGRGVAVFEAAQALIDLSGQQSGEDLGGVQRRGVEQVGAGRGHVRDMVDAGIRTHCSAVCFEVGDEVVDDRLRTADRGGPPAGVGDR